MANIDQSQSSEMMHAKRSFWENYAWRVSFRTTVIGRCLKSAGALVTKEKKPALIRPRPQLPSTTSLTQSL